MLMSHRILQESWTQEADLPDLVRAATVILTPECQASPCGPSGPALVSAAHLCAPKTSELSEAGARFSPL